jgi:2-hydroxychromene-2-carboxylate isomerase
MRLEYYFDFSCPFAYLGSVEVEEVARRTGAELVWRPMLLGGVLRAVGAEQGLAGEPVAKRKENLIDMRRWAEVRGMPLQMPPGHPQRTVRALRTILAVEESRWPAIIRELYRAYWELGQPVEDSAVLHRALAACGLAPADAELALTRAEEPAVKDELRRRTDEAVARGVFGAPTTFVGDHMFWGQDRLPMAEAALRGWKPGAGKPAMSVVPGLPDGERPASSGPATIEFWNDFSSPFSYLASCQVEAVAAAAGPGLAWEPLLDGAGIKEIGGPNVPILAMSEAKRQYMGRDLGAWASALDVPFQWTSHFPLKTVTALRLALVAGDRIAEVSKALYRAAWVDNRNIDDAAVLVDVLAQLGLDGEAMMAGTRDPAIKQRLIDLTSEAVKLDVFGAPSFVVRRGDGQRKFWGQDRIGLVERAAAGLEPPTQ